MLIAEVKMIIQAMSMPGEGHRWTPGVSRQDHERGGGPLLTSIAISFRGAPLLNPISQEMAADVYRAKPFHAQLWHPVPNLLWTVIFSLQPAGSEWHSGFFTGCQGPAATGTASGVGLGELANSAEPRNEKAKLQGVSRTVLPRSFRRCAWQ